MRRKSERNKGKTAAEKKVEKPTRRTTRRRGRGASPSASPEQHTEGNASSVAYSDEEQEQPAAVAVAVVAAVAEQQESSSSTTEQQEAISSSELIKSVLTGDEEDNGSVWKVSRADASPGEIQKLKLCRQRNISEASDSSVSRKLSNKWPDSGEGGTEEADSVDEQATSSQEMLASERADDSSSLHPAGQDSNQEVSDYVENLPETTSANLSDDKTNIDQQAVCAENETSSTNAFEPPICEDSQSTNTSTTILPGNDSNAMQVPDNGENVGESTQQNLTTSQQSKDNSTTSNDPAADQDAADAQSTESTDASKAHDMNGEIAPQEDLQDIGVITVQESVTPNDTENLETEASPKTDSIVEQDKPIQEEKTESAEVSSEANTTDSSKDEKNEKIEDEEEGEIREEVEKEPSPKPERDNEYRRSSNRKSTRITRRNHERYQKSSSSDTTDDEKETEKGDQNEEAESVKIEETIRRNRKERKNRNKSESINETDENSISVNLEPDLELSESNIEKDDILEIPEKPDDLNVSIPVSKPAKVSLKRSFSSRVSIDAEAKKDETTVEKSTTNETNQNKENHADNKQPDQKSSMKRRRWGVTTTTDVAPAFSISTDSLKALVPGAKPLSANEVKLTKDEDEDNREHRKSKSESQKSKSDSKSDLHQKKAEEKLENQAASRRKIILEKTPRPSSPSLPEAQATNILLIKNLVRPFTLNQIKELLTRTGTIVENGFWMDRIKSKCFVEYTNEDQAFETRQALHGVSWPTSNPKKLVVEYATKEDMEAARETTKEQPIVRKVEQPVIPNDLWQQDQWAREDRNNVANKITIIREWDLGKEDGQLNSKDKEKERRELEKKKRARSKSPSREAHLPPPARKFKKKEEEPPTAKLLDDLFRKTRATPCIYWLPLTNEQILVKEEMRRQHMAEHARRIEEMRRADRSRDSRRRRSPRK